MSIEILERAIARLEELKAGATGDPASWRWYSYGVSGQTLAAPNPMPGEGLFGGQAFGHDLNVLKTTNDWAPTEADQDLIAAWSRAVDPLISMHRRSLLSMKAAIGAGMSEADVNEIAERSGEVALARAVLGEVPGE